MKDKEPTKLVPVCMKLSFAKMIKIEAAKRNITVSAMIRQAIVHFLNTYNQ